MEQSILLPADTLANLSVWPGSEQARTMTVTSGRRFADLLKGADPACCCARMLLGMSRWASTLCFLTWRGSATPGNRSLFQLVPSMPDTNETECGLWPTASARDWKDTPGMARTGTNPDGSTRKREDQLARAVYARMWATPRSNIRPSHMIYDRGRHNLEEQVGASVPHGGKLNPAWVEWLMGYPVGWTDLEDSETPSCRKSPPKSSDA